MSEFPCGVFMEIYSAAAPERAILRVVGEYPRLVLGEEVVRAWVRKLAPENLNLALLAVCAQAREGRQSSQEYKLGAREDARDRDLRGNES